MATIYSVLLAIDGIIYNFICFLYEIFQYLAKTNIFSVDDYNDIVNRLYIVLGVIMLFILAYSLLRAVINPDEYSKGDKSFAKIAQNIVVSLIIIAVLPTVFSVVFNIQNSLLNYDSIPKLILGTDYDNDSVDNVTGGRAIAYYAFQAFLTPNTDKCDDGSDGCERSDIKGNGSWGTTNGTPLDETDAMVLGGKSFSYYTEYSEAVRDSDLSYYFPISTVAGIFLAYVLLNFCFDMALRVIKLCFYQIIAPIPVICRILPGGNMKDVFNKWVKQIVSLFAEVFIRVGAMSLGIYMIGLLINKWNEGLPNIGTLSALQKPIVLALLIMSIVMFIKQIPKVIGDLFGLDTGGMKLGLMDKLAAGGGLLAGAAVGGGLTSMGRNAISQFKQSRKDGHGVLSSMALGAKSGVAGGVSAAVRSGFGARNAKNLKDMKSAASAGTAKASEKKSKRDAYRASHRGSNYADTLGRVAVGHVSDFGQKAGEFWGIDTGLEDLQKEKGYADQMQGFYDKMAGYVSDNEMVASYQGLYDEEMKREISKTSFDKSSYDAAIRAKVAAMKSDSRYSGVSNDVLSSIAESELDKSTFQKPKTDKEMADAIAERQANLKKYDTLKKMATIKAVNEKLNKKNADGTVQDGRFQAVINEAEVFKQQHSDIDFVRDMSAISGVSWDASWDDIMATGSASQVDTLMDSFKDGSAGVQFFADKETAKNKSGAISADIARKVSEKKEQNSGK